VTPEFLAGGGNLADIRAVTDLLGVVTAAALHVAPGQAHVRTFFKHFASPTGVRHTDTMHSFKVGPRAGGPVADRCGQPSALLLVLVATLGKLEEACQAMYKTTCRAENAEGIAECQKGYQKGHQKGHRKENAEDVAEHQKGHQKGHRKGNAEAVAAYQKKYQKENAEAIAAHQKKYQKENVNAEACMLKCPFCDQRRLGDVGLEIHKQTHQPAEAQRRVWPSELLSMGAKQLNRCWSNNDKYNEDDKMALRTARRRHQNAQCGHFDLLFDADPIPACCSTWLIGCRLGIAIRCCALFAGPNGRGGRRSRRSRRRIKHGFWGKRVTIHHIFNFRMTRSYGTYRRLRPGHVD